MDRARAHAACLAALIATAVAVAGIASAHNFVAATASSIRYDEPAGKFKGRVITGRELCEGNRRVRLVKETADGPRTVGRDRTGREGRWRIERPNANGSFHVVIRRRAHTDLEHHHVCERGVSTTVVVDP